MGTRKWSQINIQCYVLAFTGQGSASHWCFVDGGNHTIDCPSFSPTAPSYNANPQPPAQQRPTRPPLRRPLLSSPPPPKRPQIDHYNKQDGGCPYGRDCKFSHCCSWCKKWATQLPGAHLSSLKPRLHVLIRITVSGLALSTRVSKKPSNSCAYKRISGLVCGLTS